MTPATTDHRRGLTYALIGVLVLTPDTLLVRLIAIDPWTMIFLRGSLMALVLLAYFSWRERSWPWQVLLRLGPRGWLASVLFAGNSVLFVTALAHTSVANTLLIISAGPLVAALASGLLLGEATPRRTWVAIAVVLVGMAVLLHGSLGSGRLWGDLAALGTACLLAVTFVTVRSAAASNLVPSVALGGLIAAAATVGLSGSLALDARQWSLMLLLGGLVLPLSFALLTLAPRWIPAAEVSLIILLEALLGPLWVWLGVGEVPPWQSLAGGGLILLTLVGHSCVALRVRNLQRPPPSAAPVKPSPQSRFD